MTTYVPVTTFNLPKRDVQVFKTDNLHEDVQYLTQDMDTQVITAHGSIGSVLSIISEALEELEIPPLMSFLYGESEEEEDEEEMEARTYHYFMNSSCIAGAEIDGDDLRLVFKNNIGIFYRYKGAAHHLPSLVYHDTEGSSPGKYYLNNIRGQYETIREETEA